MLITFHNTRILRQCSNLFAAISVRTAKRDRALNFRRARRIAEESIKDKPPKCSERDMV